MSILDNSLIIINLFFVFIIIIQFILIIITIRKLKQKTLKLTNIESLYNNVRGFKHDFNNIIDILGGYIETNDINGLKEYYSGLRKDCVKFNNSEILNLAVINNPGIYNLISTKQQKAKKLKTNLSLELFFDFNHLHMPVYEFSRMLGILLDNAIEAASFCEEKQVNLTFRESQKNRVQIVCIENTYNNKDVDTKAIFENGVSSKSNHSGIGLFNVNKIIKKYNNVCLHTSKDDLYFKQQLEIYY